MTVRVIIGKNFGDEGKGLATDYFSAVSQKQNSSCLVIRHNGGGQAGHTVDLPDKRFVFHQLSSGSFRNADTYWSKTFLPDLFKLSEEIKDFSKLHGKHPVIYGHPMCRCVCIDDVLVNMALETTRGSKRHGSCGMGINEAVIRSQSTDACLYLGKVCAMSAYEIFTELMRIRNSYLPVRLQELNLKLEQMGEYGELLTDSNVLMNLAEQMYCAAQNIVLKEEDVAEGYDDVIFEGAQGLLLDENYLKYAPHLTTSKTGSDNPVDFIRKYLPDAKTEFVYVTRSYITRHGAGPLPYEDYWDLQGICVTDNTNLTNLWQGSLRFAPHGTCDEFFEALRCDLDSKRICENVSCMVTHLNESDGDMCTLSGRVPVKEWFSNPLVPSYVNRLYLSYSPYSQDICSMELCNCSKVENSLQ